MTEKAALTTTCCLLIFGALANLFRFFWDISVCIGAICLPGWTGAFAFILLGLLSSWSFRELYAFAHLAALSHRQTKRVLLPPVASDVEPVESLRVEDSLHDKPL